MLLGHGATRTGEDRGGLRLQVCAHVPCHVAAAVPWCALSAPTVTARLGWTMRRPSQEMFRRTESRRGIPRRWGSRRLPNRASSEIIIAPVQSSPQRDYYADGSVSNSHRIANRRGVAAPARGPIGAQTRRIGAQTHRARFGLLRGWLQFLIHIGSVQTLSLGSFRGGRRRKCPGGPNRDGGFRVDGEAGACLIEPAARLSLRLSNRARSEIIMPTEAFRIRTAPRIGGGSLRRHEARSEHKLIVRGLVCFGAGCSS